MAISTKHDTWPALPFADWSGTCATLHLWTQVVGKVRLALTPWLNHSWHVPLYVTARGLTTSPIPYAGLTFEIVLDFVSHELEISTSNGSRRRMALEPRTVADFYAAVMSMLDELGISVRIDEHPGEIPGAIPFSQDRMHADYDAEYAQRFWRVLVLADRVLKHFRTGFTGKCSPVHFFWGSFDLAVTRFSGRTAPRHPGGVPGLADAVVQEAYSHEVSSAGFWSGGGGADSAMFYSYMPIRNRRVTEHSRLRRRQRSSASSSVSICCPTTPCARQRIRTRRFSSSCRALTKRLPSADVGIARHWRLLWAAPEYRAPSSDQRSPSRRKQARQRSRPLGASRRRPVRYAFGITSVTSRLHVCLSGTDNNSAFVDSAPCQ